MGTCHVFGVAIRLRKKQRRIHSRVYLVCEFVERNPLAKKSKWV